MVKNGDETGYFRRVVAEGVCSGLLKLTESWRPSILLVALFTSISTCVHVNMKLKNFIMGNDAALTINFKIKLVLVRDGG